MSNFCVSADNSVCSGVGTCEPAPGRPTGYACSCPQGYRAQGTRHCLLELCYSYLDPEADYDPVATPPCSGRGECHNSSTGLGTYSWCTCQEGYWNTSCQTCVPGLEMDGEGACWRSTCLSSRDPYTYCSGLGSCQINSFLGVYQCACPEPYRSTGSACIHRLCATEGSASFVECSGRGACEGEACVCEPLYGGDRCARCAHGATAVGAQCVADECLASDGRVCGGVGSCVGEGGPGGYACHCYDGQVGPASRCQEGGANVGAALLGGILAMVAVVAGVVLGFVLYYRLVLRKRFMVDGQEVRLSRQEVERVDFGAEEVLYL